MKGTLSRRTIVEQFSRSNAMKVLLEARLAPGGIWRGTAYVTSGNPVAGALTLACLLKCDEK